MEAKKIRNDVYVLDGGKVIGRVGTLRQADDFMKQAGSLRGMDEFEAVVGKLISFADAIEDELGYEFANKKDVIACLKGMWPEVYDVDVSISGRKMRKIYAGGNGWHLVLSFGASSVKGDWDTFVEMNKFNDVCAKYGFSIENYGQTFDARIQGSVKKLMLVGFRDDGRAIVRATNGKAAWLVPAAEAKKRLAA